MTQKWRGKTAWPTKSPIMSLSPESRPAIYGTRLSTPFLMKDAGSNAFESASRLLGFFPSAKVARRFQVPIYRNLRNRLRILCHLSNVPDDRP